MQHIFITFQDQGCGEPPKLPKAQRFGSVTEVTYINVMSVTQEEAAPHAGMDSGHKMEPVTVSINLTSSRNGV